MVTAPLTALLALQAVLTGAYTSLPRGNLPFAACFFNDCELTSRLVDIPGFVSCLA